MASLNRLLVKGGNMNQEIMRKYITGNATEEERKKMVEWLQERPESMKEYLAQHKLYDAFLWSDVLDNDSAVSKRRRIDFHPVLKVVMRIAACLLLLVGGFYIWEEYKAMNVAGTQTIFVPSGQRAELTLADGSKVWLNSRTSLTFPGEFNGDTRRVKLDGEAYFTVSPNTEQPFIVETNKCNVKVLGTEFNVTAYKEDEKWRTALLKGAVEIYFPGEEARAFSLEPGTMVSLEGNRMLKERIKEPDYYLWREGLLCFSDISLRDMLEKLELYYGVDIVVNNKKILDNRYTGKFRTKDGVEHVLRVLRLHNRFTYTKDDDKNLIIIN